MKIGVLALQGAFIEHVHALQRLASEIRHPIKIILIHSANDFEQLDALIIPGGESTTMMQLASRDDLLDKLKLWIQSDQPTLVNP